MTQQTPGQTPGTPSEQQRLADDALLSQRPSAIQPVVPAGPKKKPVATLVLGGVLGAAVLFGGGLVVGHVTSDSGSTSARGQGFGGGMPSGAPDGTVGRGGAGGGFTSGTIASVDGDTLTVTTSDGSTVTVTTSGDTSVTTSSEASVSDLAVGDSVTVVGQSGDDDSVAAQAITEGQTGFGGMGGGFGGGGTGGQPPTDQGGTSSGS